MTIDGKIMGMTTIINSVSSQYGYTSQGTGFFYSEIAMEATGPVNEKGQGWHEVKGIWLITNRHVAFPVIKNTDGSVIETIPDSLTFNLREEKGGKIEWLPIILSKDELLKRTKLHSIKNVDIVAIDIDDLHKRVLTERSGRKIIGSLGVTSSDLPSLSQPIIEATTDVVICSYPYGFYDTFNKFPIIKSGIIASAWGENFNGSPHFLVDAKLFEGSSGGLVISKPINIAMINGKLMHSEEKQFVFLGVYSGEYSVKVVDSDTSEEIEESFGLGVVWYSTLIPEIIKNGIAFS